MWCMWLIQGECEELERQVDARCDALIRSIERRRQWLIDAVRQDKETKQRSLKEHVVSCTCKLQKTTSLLQFCIEALKENDPVSFLQVSTGCILYDLCIRVIVHARMYAHSVHPILYTHIGCFLITRMFNIIYNMFSVLIRHWFFFFLSPSFPISLLFLFRSGQCWLPEFRIQTWPGIRTCYRLLDRTTSWIWPWMIILCWKRLNIWTLYKWKVRILYLW